MAKAGTEHGQRLNWRLRRQRRLRGWSLNDAAEALHHTAMELGEPGDVLVDGNTFSRWELGARRPGPRYTRLLCRLYRLPADELGLADVEEPGLQTDEVKRREFLRLLALTGVAALDQSHVLGLAGRPKGIDELLLNDFEAITREFVGQWRLRAPAALLPSATGHLSTLTAVLRQEGPSATKRRLRSLAAEAALLVGWLSFRLDNRGAAASSWRLAGDLADQAGDQLLAASVLLATSSLYSRVPAGGDGGGSGLALARLERGLLIRLEGVSPLLRARLLARRAEEHAVRGEAVAAHRDLDEAESALSNASNRDFERLDQWGAIQLDGYRGSCSLLLGAPEKAAATLDNVLRASEHGVARAVLIADLGAAYAQQGRIDEACAVFTEAAVQASHSTAREFVQRVVGLRYRYLRSGLAEPCVRRLDEQLLALT